MKKIAKQRGWKTVTAFVEPALRNIFVAEANTEGISLSDVIRRALKKYVDDKNGTTK